MDRMLRELPSTIDGFSDTVVPDGRTVEMANEAERLLWERGFVVHATPFNGGIGLHWRFGDVREYIEIENGDPEAERYSICPANRMRRFRTSADVSQLVRS